MRVMAAFHSWIVPSSPVSMNPAPICSMMERKRSSLLRRLAAERSRSVMSRSTSRAPMPPLRPSGEDTTSKCLVSSPSPRLITKRCSPLSPGGPSGHERPASTSETGAPTQGRPSCPNVSSAAGLALVLAAIMVFLPRTRTLSAIVSNTRIRARVTRTGSRLNSFPRVMATKRSIPVRGKTNGAISTQDSGIAKTETRLPIQGTATAATRSPACPRYAFGYRIATRKRRALPAAIRR